MKYHSVKILFFFILKWLCTLGSLPAFGQPSNPSVRSGTVTVTPGVTQTHIHQTSGKAVVNWGDFSIPGGHTVNIQQPGASAALLNRVTGGNPSNLMGNLNANGRVYLVNPNGIVVGNGARIDAGAFIASTLDVSDQDFLGGGDMLFSGTSTAGVVNHGHITASNGDVILIGTSVENHGSISASGVAALAAGREILYSPASDLRIRILTTVDDDTEEGTGVDNQGLIEAAAAELQAAGSLYELAINQNGVIRATGAEQVNGRVLLTASGGAVAVDGTLAARNADGSGGEILVGGDLRGKNPAIANAASTTVGASAVIDVSAESGNAGRAIVWADGQTTFEGTILARGAESGGDGGFAEVSGKESILFQGTADLRAPAGRTGDLLLDPASLTVIAGTTSGVNTIGNDNLETQLGLANVTLDTSTVPISGNDGSIVVDAPVTWNSGTSLIFASGNHITVNQNLNAGSGTIDFGLGFVNDGIIGSQVTSGGLTVGSGVTVSADTVVIQRNANAALLGSNSSDGPAGSVDFQGVLQTGTLDLRTAAMTGFGFGLGDTGGFSGPVSIANPANAIGTLTASVSDGTFQDDVTIMDADGGLTVDGVFNLDGGVFTLSTPGNLVLAPGAAISTTDHDIYLASTGGSFTNQAGALALQPGGSGRFLVYSDAPANLTAGGLVANPVYNKTWGGDSPVSLAGRPGNRFVYSLAPTLTLTANDSSKVAGDANPTFSFTVSGLVGGDTAGEVFTGAPVLSTPADETSPDGVYDINISQGTVTMSDFDYTLNLLGGMLTVDPAALPQLIIAIQNVIRQFGDANPDWVALYSGFVGSDNESVVSGLQVQTPAAPESSVGNYTLTPFGATAPGYTIVYQPGNLEVQPRNITLRAGDLSKTYGDALPAFSSSFENLPGFANPGDLGTVSFFSGASMPTAPAGSYDIVPSVTGNPNYNVTPANGTATVNRRPATITAPTLDREYGLANPVFVATGSNFVNNDFSNASLSFSTAAVQGSNVGNYGLTASGHDDTNYIITYQPGAVNVTPAPLTLSAQSASREYGMANPAFTYTDSGFRLGQWIGDVMTGFGLTTAATTGSNIGSYDITFSGSVTNDNYDVSFVPARLTVTRAPLLIAPTLSERFFGDNNPAFTLTGVGLRNGDTVDVVTQEQFRVLTNPQSDVGGYPVEILGATALNYQLSFNPGIMNILPRPLTIAADNQTREYGDANPVLTAQFDNLAPFHSDADIVGLDISTPATANSNVLPDGYGINVTTGSNPNYDIRTVPGTLMVTPAPLTVTVEDASRVYASANPAFSATLGTGLKAGDTENDLLLSFNTTAVPQSDVGVYPVNVSSINPNYAFSVRSGELEITPAQLSVLGTPFDRIYGDNPPLSYNLNVAGLQFGATADQVVRVNDPTERGTDIGLYSYTVSSLDPNYEVGTLSGNTFRILQRPLNLSLRDVERYYGDNNPRFVLMPGSNLVPDLDPVESVLAFSAPGRFALPGTYSVDPILINGNYRINLQGFGRLTVLKRPLRIEIDHATRYYGDDNPVFGYREVGGVGFPDFENPENLLMPFTFEFTDSRSTPGYYLIGGRFNESLTDRYDLQSLRPGILTVAPRPVSLFIDDIFRQYANGTPLSEIAVFSEFSPSGGLDNTVNGDTLASVFPGLTFAIVEEGETFELENPPALNNLSRPDLSEFGTSDLLSRGAERTRIGFRRSGGRSTRSASTAARPVTFTLSADGSSLIADRPIGLSGATSIRRLAIIPAGEYLGVSDLYQLTDVNAGLLTLTERSYVEELKYLRENDEERYNELVNPTLTIEVGDFVPLYERNMGFLFRDYPDVGVDLVESWLLRQFENGELDLSEGGLWYAIFGGMDLEPPAFDRFTIRQWMKGIETAVEKRGLIALATLDYYKILQNKDPEDYSHGETQMVNSLLGKVNRERAEFANELLQRKQTYENFPVASQMLYVANDNLKVIENRAALAANAFLTDFAHVLGEREQEVLGLLVSSILDGDRSSSIPLLEEWIAMRENADPRTIFDDQTLGFLQEMQIFQEQVVSAEAAIASGEDYPNPDGFDGLTPYRLETTPYADFLSETTFSGLEAKLARYDLTANTGGVLGVAAGVGAGYAGVTSSVFVGTLQAAIFPFARGGAHGLLVASAGGAAGAHIAAGVAAAAVAVNTVAIIHLVQNGEQEVIFNELVAGETPIRDFSSLDFSPATDTVSEDTPPEDLANHIFKEMLVNSLADMLEGR